VFGLKTTIMLHTRILFAFFFPQTNDLCPGSTLLFQQASKDFCISYTQVLTVNLCFATSQLIYFARTWMELLIAV
jgi:hypothetical protein